MQPIQYIEFKLYICMYVCVGGGSLYYSPDCPGTLCRLNWLLTHSYPPASACQMQLKARPTT